MDMTVSPAVPIDRPGSLLQLRRFCASFAAIIALIVLIGWTFEIELFKRILPGFVAMNPTTAICLLLSAMALVLNASHGAARAAAAAVIALATAKLVEVSTGFPLRVDQLFFASSLDDAAGAPNRMAPNTALALALLGLSLLAVIKSGRRTPLLSQLLAGLAACIALFALIGYLLGLGNLYGIARFIPMALHTAICIMVLAAGVFSAHPRRGLMKILLDRGPAGSLSRIILPLAVLMPVAVSFLRLMGQRAGFYDTETGVAVQVVANVILTSSLLLGIIILPLYRTDRLRRQREVIVSRSEEQNRLAERVASVGHWRMELPSKNLEWSEELFRIAGLNPAQGMPAAEEVLELYHPEDRDKARSSLIHAFKTGKGWEFTVRLVRPDGEIRSVKSHGVTERGADGPVCAVFGVFADVTELDKTRHAAEEATAAKSSFLAHMSHEIRTPLNSIIGFSDLLLEEPDLDHKHRRQLELIQNSGGTLLTVVNDILDFSKLEAGKVELHCQPFVVAMLVDNTVTIVQRSAEAKGLEMQVALDPELASYYLGDEDRLRQILHNLINNAIKFTSHGSVSVKVKKLSSSDALDRLLFEVGDTGIGISSEKQSRLFQPFSQADASVSREYGGTGLGLAISKSLVEIMHGTIGVVSSEGTGSTFWFELDLPSAEAPDERPGETASVGDAHTGYILLAEDFPINQELACAILSRAGHRIDVASDGAEAVRLVQQKKYDLVLMDIQMPKMDGITATQRIRALPGEVSGIPIVAMTANVLPEQVKEFKRIGMDGYIGKPIKQAQLHSEIQRVLSGIETIEIFEEQAPTHIEFFDQETYSKIAGLLPKDRLQAHLSSFEHQLRTLFSERDPEVIKATAHKLISQAGMLGFILLSKNCRELEGACESQAAPDVPLAAAQLAADQALRKVAELKDWLAQGRTEQP